ncbi:MAG: glycosyltransferase, partial [Planctomycetes bacterium]|nr:glycosyltransferase [Planctomycetota bacterium]
MSLHVAHLVTSFDVGGLQNGIVNLVNGSDPERLRHSIISMWPRVGLADRLQRGEVMHLGIEPGVRAQASKLVASRLKALRPDIVHTRNWGTWTDGVLGARRAGIATRIHGFHGRDLANAHGESFKRRVVGRGLAAMTTGFITLTDSMKRELAHDFFLAGRRITVIPNGVDLDRLAAFSADEACRSSFTVLTVGRLDAVKNLPLLVRAFAGMKNRQPSDRLVIVGEGPERATVERIGHELKLGEALVLLGERRDAPACMKAADLYVQPSFYEGMSNTI